MYNSIRIPFPLKIIFFGLGLTRAGNSVPDTTMLMPLCKALDISVNELLSCEKILPENYPMKAEENIMALIEENKQTQKSNMISKIVGTLVLCVGLILLAVTTSGLSFPIMNYIDLPSIIIFVLINVGVVLVAGVRTKKKVLELLRRTSIPVGVLFTIINVVIVLIYVDKSALVAANLAVAILPVLYSMIVKVVVEILMAKQK